MQKDKIISLAKSTLQQLLEFEYGTQPFWIVSLAYLLTFIVVGIILAKWIGGSPRGKLGITISMLIPLALALSGYIWGQINLPEMMANDKENILKMSLAIAGVAGGFTSLIIAPFFIGIGFFKTLVVVTFTIFSTIGIGRFVESYCTDKKITWPQKWVSEVKENYYN